MTMNIAVLFNSNHPEFVGNYAYAVMRRILGTGVLQSANRNMRVSTGDILTYSAASELKVPLTKLCEKVYRPGKFGSIASPLLPKPPTRTVSAVEQALLNLL